MARARQAQSPDHRHRTSSVSGRQQRQSAGQLSQTLPSFQFKANQQWQKKGQLSGDDFDLTQPSSEWLGVEAPSTCQTMSRTSSEPWLSTGPGVPGLLPRIREPPSGQRRQSSTANGTRRAPIEASERGVETGSAQREDETLSPSIDLRRENGELRSELGQMQASVLESLRRGDRFMSGSGPKCFGQLALPPSVLKEREELRRAKQRTDELQKDRERLEEELRRVTARLDAALEVIAGKRRASSLAPETRKLSGAFEKPRTPQAELAARLVASEQENEMLRNNAAEQASAVDHWKLQAEHAEEAEFSAERRSQYMAQELHAAMGMAESREPAEPPGEGTSSSSRSSAANQALAQRCLSRLASCVDDGLITRLCFHGWHTSMCMTRELRIAQSQIERERSEREAEMRVYELTQSELMDEKAHLSASLNDCENLRVESRRLSSKAAEAQEAWLTLHNESVKLRQQKQSAEDARNHERAEVLRWQEEMRFFSESTASEKSAALSAEQRVSEAERAAAEADARATALHVELRENLSGTDAASMRIQQLVDDGDEQKQHLEALIKERSRLRNDKRVSVDRLSALEAEHQELQRKHGALLDEFQAQSQASAKEKLRQMFRLQVLAPSVTVSLPNRSMDVKVAPSEGQIRKVMTERVLPQFAQVLLHDDSREQQPAGAAEQTSQLVQSVVSGMVAAIEDKLQALLGTSCVRIAAKN